MTQHVRHCLKKRKYHTQAKARAVAALRQREGAPKLRVYWCNICGGHHLTKQPPRGDEGEEVATNFPMGATCYVIDPMGVAWCAKVIAQTKCVEGAVTVEWWTPRGLTKGVFMRHLGLPCHATRKGCRLVERLSEGDEREPVFGELVAELEELRGRGDP